MTPTIEYKPLPIEYKPLPGDFVIWLFIFMELAVFGLLFLGFVVAGAVYPEEFAAGSKHVNRTAGFVNTVALISSSYMVVRSVLAIEHGDNRASGFWTVSAIGCGWIYVFVKLWEYSHVSALGFDMETNTFYTLYFFTTLFHLAHVLLGMVILAFVAFKTFRGGYTVEDHYGVETGASYWHMVDLVWVILFTLIYVMN